MNTSTIGPVLKVEPSLSGANWCITMDGDRANPLYQSDRRWHCEDMLPSFQSAAKRLKAATVDSHKL